MRSSKRMILTPSPSTGEGWGEGGAIGTILGSKNQPSHLLVIIFLSAITLSACTVGPDYVRPTPDMPEQWRTPAAETAASSSLSNTDLLGGKVLTIPF